VLAQTQMVRGARIPLLLKNASCANGSSGRSNRGAPFAQRRNRSGSSRSSNKYKRTSFARSTLDSSVFWHTLDTRRNDGTGSLGHSA